MTALIERPATREAIFVWVMHRFARAFEEHAVLKGGMALRLLDSPRVTNDIDYLFVPFESKRQVLPKIKQLLGELEDARIEIDLHSKMLRAEVYLDEVAIQIEVSVAKSCASQPMATGGFARDQGLSSQIVRVMDINVALAHKLAAWNERRLKRDLYDIYFLSARAGATPDAATLATRLAKVRSQLPAVRRVRKMSLDRFCAELEAEAEALTDEEVRGELQPLLPANELAGLALRIRVALVGLIESLGVS